MKIRSGSFIVKGLAYLFLSVFAGTADAQLRPVSPLPVMQTCQPATPVYIRNLRYDDYSRYSRLNVLGNGFIQIATNCMQLDGNVVVTLQDVNANGPGVAYCEPTTLPSRRSPAGVRDRDRHPDHRQVPP